MSKELITQHLLVHGSIDEMDAARFYGVFSLSRVISRIRKDGHRIKASSVTRKMRLATGEAVEKTFGLYTLLPARGTHSVLVYSTVMADCEWILDIVDCSGRVNSVEFDYNEDVTATAKKLRKLADQLEAL